jgi:hypothetical protein
VSRRDLDQVVAFRNRLVEFMNYVRAHVAAYSFVTIEPVVQRHISSEQTALAQEYGRLSKIINRWGGMAMSSPALGVTSSDVIQDAIFDIQGVYYNDICRLAVQHLDIVIGKLTGEVRESGIDPDFIYRLTSPLYWFRRLVDLLRWLGGTARGRVVAAIAAVLLAIISGLPSGAGGALVERLLNHPSPVP